MPSFNENPTEFADLNNAFPELNSQVGLSYEQVRAIGENTYFNRNQNAAKASKVANATSGNLAGLDASGNLTDSGVAPTDLQAKMQYSTMPTASADNVGAIVQYIGDTNGTYTNGYFYKCVESGGTYGWDEVISGGGDVPANMVTTDTNQTITGTKTIQTLNTTNFTASGAANPVVKCLSYNTSYLTGSYRGIETTYDKISFVHGGSTSSYIPSAYVQFKPNMSHEYAGMSYYTRNSNGTLVEKLSTDYLQIYLTGAQIHAKISDNSFINGQVVTCTQTYNTYEANHIYRLTSYANGTSNVTWTATDITPNGSAPNNMVTTDTVQTITADKFFTEKLISGAGNYYLGQAGIYGIAGWCFGRMYSDETSILYLLTEVVSTRTPSNKIWGTHINPNTGHIYTVRTSNNEDYWEDITPFKKEILTNTRASTWVADNTYAGYGYKCEISATGVTANDLAEVTFGVAEATSGNYAPVVETGAGTITIYSKVDTAITIPTIKVEKL